MTHMNCCRGNKSLHPFLKITSVVSCSVQIPLCFPSRYITNAQFIVFVHFGYERVIDQPDPGTDINNSVNKVDINEPPHDKTNKMACAPSEDSDQPGHPPSLIRVFAIRIQKACVLSYPLSAQRSLWSDFAERTTILLVLSWGGSNVERYL